MRTPTRTQLEALWAEHDGSWRDPADALGAWEGPAVESRLVQGRASGAWWDVLDAAGITLLVTREYEHLVMALSVVAGRPRVTYLPLPHPSGLAVDRASGRVAVASTRNPNQVYELAPARATLARADVRPPPVDGCPLLPLRSSIYPGAFYIHDLAYIGGSLHANAVGLNAVVRLDDRGPQIVWWPRSVERGGRPDTSRNWIQLNSIAPGRTIDASYYTASAERISARRPGHRNFPVDRRGVIFSGATREPFVRGLTRPHSARLHRGRLWADDSGYGDLVIVRDGELDTVSRLPGWTRGLCFRDNIAFVGTSRVIPRYQQYAPGLDVNQSRCAVHAVDISSGVVVGSMTWPLGNQIFAVDWIPRVRSTGLPYGPGARGRRGRATRLFYSFDPSKETKSR